MEKTIDDKNNKIVEPKNYLDPIVYHDPSISADVISKVYTPQYNESDTNLVSPRKEYSNERLDGVSFPVIKINNINIDLSNIVYFKIDSKGFVPTLVLTIYDYNNLIKFKDMPGMNNVITVYLGSLNNDYKGIKLNFYITNVNVFGDKITYNGIYKLFKLKNSQLKSIVHSGCSKCKTSSTSKLNTFEYLHDIALDCGLGFAATDKCKDINDRLSRILISQNYEDFIEQQIQFSGVDENSIFDCWIDFYNYLVLVNVSWVLNENNDPNCLSIYAELGVDSYDETMPIPKTKEVVRTINNSNELGISNLLIESYENIVKNNNIVNYGNLKTLYCLKPEGNNGNNSINTFQIQTIEDSIDGKHIEDYEIKKTCDIIFDFNDYNINKQKIIRTDFLNKKRSKILKVKLQKINYGLTRGMLVNVCIFEYDPVLKREILYSYENINGENDKINIPNMTLPEGITIEEIINSSKIGLVDFSKSDQYYIDGVEIIYNQSCQKFDQYLYLIKKGSHNNYTNKYTLPKIKI